MAFMGESCGVSDLAALSGSIDAWNRNTGLYYCVLRINDGKSYTLVAGDSFIVLVDSAGYLYPQDGDTADIVKWVFNASGNGVLELTDGYDTNYDYTGNSFTPIESVSINSNILTEYESEASAPLHDNSRIIWDNGEPPALKVTVVSGTVTLDKIRLQLEPAGGFKGHWSDWRNCTLPVESDATAVQYARYVNMEGYGELYANKVSKITPRSGAWAIAAAGWVNTEYQSAQSSMSGVVFSPGTWNAWNFVPVPWQETRPQYTYEDISSLNYYPRPDRTQKDEGYNLTYLPNTDATLFGWSGANGWEGPGEIVVNYSDWEGHLPIPGSLHVELNFGIVPLSPGDNPVFPGLGSGTEVAHLTSYGQSRIPWVDPGPVPTIGLFVYDTAHASMPYGYYQSGYAYLRAGPSSQPISEDCYVKALILPPPFRVWIGEGGKVGIPPMRQRHRDDGLATDARQMNGSGSSLQSSIRRGGQVYY